MAQSLRRTHGDLARWALCLAAVLAVHAMLLLQLRHLRPSEVGGPVPPPAVLLDLAPAIPLAPAATAEPAAPPAPTTLSAPPSDIAPPAPPPETRPPPPVTAQPPPREVTLPEPPPPPQATVHEPRPSPRQHSFRSRPADMPPTRIAPAAPPVPAPVLPPAAAGAAKGLWERAIAAHLARFKSYPVLAQRHGEEGLAVMRIVVDRAGRLLGATLERSSGHSDLDHAAEEWVERAQPFPPPPDDVAGTHIELAVPLGFTLR